MTDLLALEHVHVTRSGQSVLNDVSFTVGSGERIALVGANGAGKTTLLRTLVGLETPQSGTMTAFGAPRRRDRDFREVRAKAGFLFQDPDDQLFCPTVVDDVAFGPLNLGRSQAEAAAIARDTLAWLGLAHLAERITHRLSGGEKRLVSLAGVLAMGPQVLLLDEPINGLDDAAAALVMDTLESLSAAMVIVSHARGMVTRLATRAVLLEDGRLTESIIHEHPHTHTHRHVHPVDQTPAHTVDTHAHAHE